MNREEELEFAIMSLQTIFNTSTKHGLTPNQLALVKKQLEANKRELLEIKNPHLVS